MNLRSGGARDLGVLPVPASTTRPPTVLREHPTAPVGHPACSDRLPRDVLLRLAALTHQVRALRQEHGAGEMALRLDDVATGLADVTQSIYDDTAQHFAGRRV